MPGQIAMVASALDLRLLSLLLRRLRGVQEGPDCQGQLFPITASSPTSQEAAGFAGLT